MIRKQQITTHIKDENEHTYTELFSSLLVYQNVDSIQTEVQFVSNQLYMCNKSTSTCIKTTLYRNDFVSKWLCIKMTRHPSLNHTLSPPGFKKWSPARRISWLLNKFPLSTLWDVSRIVRRICKLMLGCEGSKYFFSRL